MSSALRGETVQLAVPTATGTVDGFGRTEYTEDFVCVKNVLIAPVSSEEILDTLNLTGKRAVYQLGIPKGDTHVWENRSVRFFGHTFRTIGESVRGIDSMIPLDWNKRIKVELIE